MPTGRSMWPATIHPRNASAPGPPTSIRVNAVMSKTPARSRTARCSAIAIGDQ